ADRTHRVDALAGRILQLPVLVALSGEDGTGVAAAHRDHDVGLLHGIHREQLRLAARDVDARLFHRFDRDRVDLVLRLGAGGAHVDAVPGEVLQEAGGHLRSAGVMHADEQDGGGGVGHGVSSSAGRVNRAAVRRMPIAAPSSWAPANCTADSGEMPANVSLNTRPRVTARLANEVELVNQYAAPMYAPTATAMAGMPWEARTIPAISSVRPAVAITSPSSVPALARSWEEIAVGTSNIAFASSAPPTPPA